MKAYIEQILTLISYNMNESGVAVLTIEKFIIVNIQKKSNADNLWLLLYDHLSVSLEIYQKFAI